MTDEQAVEDREAADEQSLREELLEHPLTARTQGTTQGELALASSVSRANEAGNVGATEREETDGYPGQHTQLRSGRLEAEFANWAAARISDDDWSASVTQTVGIGAAPEQMKSWGADQVLTTEARSGPLITGRSFGRRARAERRR
jgi:hypothetical protein